MARIYVPLPDADFDTTEVAVPYKLWKDAGHDVVFGTEAGATPACDPRLLDGVLFGQLGADPEPVAFYRELQQDPAFRAPIRWASAEPAAFDALHLAGGHAPGMRQYLGSDSLQAFVAAFFATGKPVSAICHGVLVAARARDPQTGRSPLYGRKTTCLPKYMELLAWSITAWKLGNYYRTYARTVQDEVIAALASEGDFARGPITLTRRGTATDDTGAFVVRDGRYVSARWPGDAYALARALLELL